MDRHRKIGRPKLRWSDVLRKDVKEKQVKIEEAQDWRTWEWETRGIDHKYRNRQKEKVKVAQQMCSHINIGRRMNRSEK